MTRKLKTMLLPTGEFALIATGFAPGDDEVLYGFRKQIGAAGALVSEDPIDVEDALVDERAYRSTADVTFSQPQDDEEEPEQLPETDSTDPGYTTVDETHLFLPNAQFRDVGLLNPGSQGTGFSVEFTTAGISPGIRSLLFGDLAPAEQPEPDTFPIDYSQDSRLVDLVAQIRYEDAQKRNPSWPHWEGCASSIKSIWLESSEAELKKLSV